MKNQVVSHGDTKDIRGRDRLKENESCDSRRKISSAIPTRDSGSTSIKRANSLTNVLRSENRPKRYLQVLYGRREATGRSREAFCLVSALSDLSFCSADLRFISG